MTIDRLSVGERLLALDTSDELYNCTAQLVLACAELIDHANLLHVLDGRPNPLTPPLNRVREALRPFESQQSQG